MMVTASALVALAVWPFFQASRPVESAPLAGDRLRDSAITFWEGAVREHHANDMLSPRKLAGLYLQRYREMGDVGDLERAQAMARRSLAVQPRNAAALAELSETMLALHRFRESLHYVDAVLAYDPTNGALLAQRASLLMELGAYTEARKTLDRIAPADRNDLAVQSVLARYDELTGRLSTARALLAGAAKNADADETTLAQSRAWFHLRSGELAFEAGDNAAAIREERTAIRLFPTYNLALKDLAKFELANHRYADALDAAKRGANVTPFPETIGYESDAEAKLGNAREAAADRDTIFAIERIGNAYRLSDRLLAIYYADHRLRPDDALEIARREAALRGPEIYAQDTLAWAAAMAGHWSEARAASAAALRYGTQDPILWYHAGVIAQHDRAVAEARKDFERALAANSHFHPEFADDARSRLASL